MLYVSHVAIKTFLKIKQVLTLKYIHRHSVPSAKTQFSNRFSTQAPRAPRMYMHKYATPGTDPKMLKDIQPNSRITHQLISTL